MRVEAPIAQPTVEARVRTVLLTVFFISLPLAVAIQQTALGCLLAFLAYVGWRDKGLPATPLDRPLIGFFAVLLLSALFCPSVVSSLLGFRKLWLVGAFFAVYHLLTEPREAWRLSVATVLTAIAVAAYGIVQHYTGLDLDNWLRGKPPSLTPFWFGREEGFRAEGFFPTGITYAHNMAFPLTLLTVWCMAPDIKWRERIGLLCGWSVMILALLFTLTRGVWIAYLLVLIVLGAMKGGRTALAVGACVAFIALALAATTPGVWERAKYSFDLQTNIERSEIWRANLDMIKERPLLGWGYGNYKRFRGDFYQRYPQVDTTAHAHNNFLQMGVDAGVIGLVAFLFLFWSILRKGWRAYQRLPANAKQLRILALGGALGVAVFLIGGLTQYNFGDAEVVIMMWTMAGVVMRIYTWTREGGGEWEKAERGLVATAQRKQ